MILAYLAGIKIFADEAIGGRPLLLLGALLFLTGVILVNFGLMGELLVRTWHESQGKPIYVVQERRPRRSRTAGSAPPLTRVLFLTESFHPRARRRRDARPPARGGHGGQVGTGATVITRGGTAAWPAREDVLDGIRVQPRPPPGPGRTGKYLMLPAALAAALPARAASTT